MDNLHWALALLVACTCVCTVRCCSFSDTGTGGRIDYDDYDFVGDRNAQLDHEYCSDPELRALANRVVAENANSPVDAAINLQRAAQNEYGGGGRKFQAVVSDCQFGYVNWYSGKICKLRTADNLHVMVWED